MNMNTNSEKRLEELKNLMSSINKISDEIQEKLEKAEEENNTKEANRLQTLFDSACEIFDIFHDEHVEICEKLYGDEE